MRINFFFSFSLFLLFTTTPLTPSHCFSLLTIFLLTLWLHSLTFPSTPLSLSTRGYRSITYRFPQIQCVTLWMRTLHHHLSSSSPPFCHRYLSQKCLGCLSFPSLFCCLTFILILHTLPLLPLCLYATLLADFKHLAPPAVSFGQECLIPDVIPGEITVSLQFHFYSPRNFLKLLVRGLIFLIFLVMN